MAATKTSANISDMAANDVSLTCLMLTHFLATETFVYSGATTDTSPFHAVTDHLIDDVDAAGGGAAGDLSPAGHDTETAWVRFALRSIVNPTLCVIGLIGNTLNVVVMTRRRMRSALDGRMERASRTGLVSLAAADMLCCVVSLTIAAFGKTELTVFRSRDRFNMLVVAYGPYLQNALLRASTWLTVVTAVGRYFAICRPLQTRNAAEPRTTRIAVCAAFVGSALMELPTAWTYQVSSFDCGQSFSRSSLVGNASTEESVVRATYYLLDHGPFGYDNRLRMASTVVGAVVGFLLPAAILSFCTARLLSALRESLRISRCNYTDVRHRGSDTTSTTGTGSARGRRLTVTLVAIVVFYLLLVSPSELLHMLYYAVQREHFRWVGIAIDIANVLQTLNFALNFVLYCAFNSQFRATWRHLFCPRLVGDGLPGDGVLRPAHNGRGCMTVRYDRHLQQAVAMTTPASSAGQGTLSGRVDVRLPVVVTFGRQDPSSHGSSSASSAQTR